MKRQMTKSILSMVLALAIFLCLTACAETPNPTTSNSATTTQPTESTQPATTPEPTQSTTSPNPTKPEPSEPKPTEPGNQMIRANRFSITETFIKIRHKD